MTNEASPLRSRYSNTQLFPPQPPPPSFCLPASLHPCLTASLFDMAIDIQISPTDSINGCAYKLTYRFHPNLFLTLEPSIERAREYVCVREHKGESWCTCVCWCVCHSMRTCALVLHVCVSVCVGGRRGERERESVRVCVFACVRL